MTVREEVQQRIEQDPELIRLRQKIESGKATYADTAAYSNRAGKLLGEVFSRRLPEIPPEEREPLCVELLHDQYIDINAAVDTAQRFMDEALGIHIAPQHAPYNEERAHQIGSSLRDLSKPVETLQRRSGAATETATKAMHDDRMKSETKFRHRAGLDCRITRVAVNGCCPWCSKVAGRYRYGEEPDDIYRRHDNCDCTVTFENGRKRQDVWSKREWEVPGKDAGADDAVVLTAEQAQALQQTHLIQQQNYKITEKKDQNALSVDRELVNSKAYHDKFEALTKRKQTNESLYQQAKRLLEARDGSEGEGLIILDSRTGRIITDNLSRQVQKLKTGLTKEEYQLVKENTGNIIMLHNHPDGSQPSGTDILTLWRESKADATVIVGHDGAVYIIYEIDRNIPLDKIYEKVYNDIVAEGKPKDFAKVKAGEALYELGAFSFIKR